MIEKVNPSHPDKIADRIAGAIVDYAYTIEDNPCIAVEVLIGHGDCNIIAESTIPIDEEIVENIVKRIARGGIKVNLKVVPQDRKLHKNQKDCIRCGDNGIFKGVPLSDECTKLSKISRQLYKEFPYDGKYIYESKENDKDRLIICQSNADFEDVVNSIVYDVDLTVNPLGYWSGGLNVDTGATNRKLGSDMGESVTGGGLHGKDLSKADVSVNIFCFLLAQGLGREVKLCCAIGDESVCGIPYSDIVSIARNFVNKIGGFEKLAEWGLF